MWDAWLDLALGSRCVGCDRPGRVLCPPCAAALPGVGVRVSPDAAPYGLAPVFAAGPYAEELRAMIIAHKEHRVLALATPLGEVLAAVVASVLGPALARGTALALVPVPSAPRTVRQRGHDPVARMVRHAGRVLRRAGYQAAPTPLLRRYRPVEDQAGLSAGDRWANLDGAFAVDTAALRRFSRRLAGRGTGAGTALVVCDDVITTGATLSEARRALAEVGLEVTVIAVVAATGKRST